MAKQDRKLILLGQTLAHYKLTASIGAGGMRQVSRATDTKLAETRFSTAVIAASLANCPSSRSGRRARL